MSKPQSEIVRDAIHASASRPDRLGEKERRHMLRVLDRVMARPAERTQAAVNAEINGIRAARRTGGRRTKHSPRP